MKPATRTRHVVTSVRTTVAVVVAFTLGVATLGAVAGPAHAADFTEHLTFEGYAPGALNGQDGWAATSKAQVVPDPLNANNLALQIQGGRNSASRAVPAIEDGKTGTMFFRFMRTGSVDASFGLTDVDSPTAFKDSRAYVNNQNTDTLLARDGAEFTPIGDFAADTWQCVWVVADNAADDIDVYSQGGEYRDITRLPEGVEESFGFREGVSGALDRFFWITGDSSAGALAIDDVSVDTTGENLDNPTGNPADCAAPEDNPSTEPLTNPLPDPVKSELGIEVTEVAQLPASQTTPKSADDRLNQYNRITHLDEVPDNSGRLMVPDMNDILYLVDKRTGEHEPYLNVRDRFIDNFHNNAGLGTGLGSAEFHPEFANNGLFYTVHTEAGSAIGADSPTFPGFGTTAYHSVVTEWKATDPSAQTFSGTNREVMRVPFPGRAHTVQQISFNPTVQPGDPDYGNLYILSGDGAAGVGNDNPQDLTTPHGKILRIDPLGTDSDNGAYGIPNDNPFLDNPEALREIYAIGTRDPHRISWDPEGDHTMYLGHIGEWQVESIYEVQPGDNFGWSEREGPFRASNRDIYELPENDAENGFTYPVAAYDHDRDPGQVGDAGVAVNGGFVYRGEIEQLKGKYLFTDLVRGWVLSTEADEMVRNDGDIEDLATISQLRVFADGKETTFADLVGKARVDLRFGSDADGELYLVSKANGKIWKVTGARTAGTPTTPADCNPGPTKTDLMAADNWTPQTPDKWEFPEGEAVLTVPGTAPTGVRRPFEFATLNSPVPSGSVKIEAEVKLDAPVAVNNRDVILVFGYKSDTEYYYAHLSQDNTIYAHNGIFKVNNADRERIDDQWNGSVGAAPAVTDEAWHGVKLVHCAESGEIAVYMDGSNTPLMTATDKTFGSGKVGFGSFDNVGRIRNLAVSSEPVKPVEPTVEPTLVNDDGAWCWFSDPRAIRYSGIYERTFTGSITRGGSPQITQYDHTTRRSITTTLHVSLQKDDHNNPAILIREDGRLIAFYSKHGSEKKMYYRISTNPGDSTSWQPEQFIETQDRVTYANPVMLSAENNRIYLFTRDANFKPTVQYSDDQGNTWSKPTQMLDSDGARPYVKVESNGVDEIYFAFTDGHPRDEAENSIYYMVYRDGAFYKANGEKIGSMDALPMPVAAGDKVYDGGSSTGRSWIWDITAVDGKPTLVYTRLPSETAHEYRYATWDGKAWQDKLISPGGGWFPQTLPGATEREPHYSGGVALDHNNPNVVYLSRPIDGQWEIEKRTTKDGGSTWDTKAVTSNSKSRQIRPYVIKNHDGNEFQVAWMSGEYVHYTNYSTDIVTNGDINKLPGSLKFDFGTAASPLAKGYSRVSKLTHYSKGGYGWEGSSPRTKDRAKGGPINRDFAYDTTQRRFSADVADGKYQVSLKLGGNQFALQRLWLSSEGRVIDKAPRQKVGKVQSTRSYTVTVEDGTLNLDLKVLGGSSARWVVSGLTIKSK